MEINQSAGRRGRLLIAGVLLSSVVMRSPISALGPILQTVREAYAMNNALAGSITTIPMLLFALMSLAAPLLLRRVAANRLQLWGMVLVLAGLLIRSYLGVAGLFAGTVLLGLGVGVSNVLIPRAIKQDFPDKVELLTGTYTAIMSLFAALGSGFSVPMAAALGWRQALAIWAPFAAAAVLAWALAGRGGQSAPEQPQDTGIGLRELLKSSMAWKITLCMGFQSAVYFCVLAWLPSFLQARGMAPQAAGYTHLFVQLAGMVSAFVVPVVMRRMRDHRKCLVPLVLMILIGLCSLLLGMPVWLQYFLLLLLGFGMGSGLSYTMTTLSLRAQSAAQVVSLSALAQTGGYIIAAIGPTLVGGIYDFSGSLPLQVISIMFFGLGYLVFGSMAAIRPGGQRGI